jgi:hypothetical protein
MSTRFTVNADYEVIDLSPLRLAAGERVRVVHADRVWPGWSFVHTAEGRGTYLPDAVTRDLGGGLLELREAFDATDLSVTRGELVESSREADGWHWCRNAAGRCGWVPGYLLTPPD